MRQKNQNKIVICLLIVLLIVFSFPYNTFASTISKAGVVNLVNKERTERGLNTLSVNSNLERAAQWKAEDMIEKDYWEHFHNGKSPWAWMKEAGYSYIDAGENLAIDFEELEPMHDAWMNSPTHRDNIINSKYKEIGIGIASGDYEGHETIIVVQMFGNPKTEAKTPTIKQEENEITDTNLSADGFEAKADENNYTEPERIESETEVSLVGRLINGVKNFVYQIGQNYKSNWQRNIALIKTSIFHNYSASANN